jgi:hypothetical protein
MPYCFEKSSYTDIDKYKKSIKKQREEKWKNLRNYIETKKQPCLFCGSNNDIEFHHINPTEKEHTVASLISFSYKKIDEETSKCWCLCSDCHKKLHRRMCDPLPICYTITF